jgi:phage-related protein
MNYFSFDGFRSDSAGLLVERKKTYGLPERDVEKIHVPGRSGDVLIDHGSYKNVRVSYDCAARSVDALELLRSALTAGGGYRLLTDSYSPWQRMALFASALDFDELILNRAYRFSVVFDCKPQRWFDREQLLSASTITSPSKA